MLSSFCSSSLSKACLKLIAQSNIMHTRLIASWHLRSYSLRVAVPPPPLPQGETEASASASPTYNLETLQ